MSASARGELAAQAPLGQPAVASIIDVEPERSTPALLDDLAQVLLRAAGDVDAVDVAAVLFLILFCHRNDVDVELLAHGIDGNGGVDAEAGSDDAEVAETAIGQLVADNVGAAVGVLGLLPIVRQVRGEVEPAVRLDNGAVDLSLGAGRGRVLAADQRHILGQRGELPGVGIEAEEPGSMTRAVGR